MLSHHCFFLFVCFVVLDLPALSTLLILWILMALLLAVCLLFFFCLPFFAAPLIYFLASLLAFLVGTGVHEGFHG